MKRREDEAIAWIKKYFNEASVENMFLLEESKGMKESKLISNPIHAPIHELAHKEINIPLINILKKRIFVELLGIRKERSTL